ncbi:MAG: bifunctional phosphopantothenoylcysteine decarboxylase/phosphopantothenate--cysteine ligase CoaBC, partial [Methanobacteriota archaeon]
MRLGEKTGTKKYDHTSKMIIGSKSKKLFGKKIVLCVTGSVAAVMSPEIARELMRHGAEVFVVMSFDARRIVHPNLLEWATGNPVTTRLTGKTEHVQLAGEHPDKADLVLVAPSTANTISKIAHGIDDTPVTTLVSTALGSNTPVLVAPAMHKSMYKNPLIAENLRKLSSMGVSIVAPRWEEGKTKMADVDTILFHVIHRLHPKPLEGRRVLVTAGPTLEWIDPVRVITNRSSGKMGVAIAWEASLRGADVTMVYGPGTAPPPSQVETIRVETSHEMYEKTLEQLREKRFDLLIATAAMSDFKPERVYPEKLPSEKGFSLRLVPTKKLIDEAKKVSPQTFLVGFKAEVGAKREELVERAHKRLLQSGADLFVAN